VIALVVLAAGTACKNSDSVTGLGPPPTPAPVIAGDWTGSYSSYQMVLCVQTEAGTATASLTQNGATVTGTLVARGGSCGFNGRVQANRSGNQLTGTVTDGAYAGTLDGVLTGAELQLTVGILSNASGATMSGGTADLHRP
jgi:hypothetical protein